MTRNEAKQNLILIGITEPTDEQITNYLNQVNSESRKEKDKAEQYKSEIEKLSGLQQELDDLKSANLSDIEKATKSLEEANRKIAELERREALGNQRKSAMEQFKISGAQAAEIFKDDGSFDMEILGKIISEKETAAAIAKEQDIANNSTNPNGGNANQGGGTGEKPLDVANAENITFGSVGKEAQSAKDYYK